MNTLAKDLDEFITRRIDYIERNVPVPEPNTYADRLERTLNQEQLKLLNDAFDFQANSSSIREECAYRQGLIDALQLMGSLRACL